MAQKRHGACLDKLLLWASFFMITKNTLGCVSVYLSVLLSTFRRQNLGKSDNRVKCHKKSCESSSWVMIIGKYGKGIIHLPLNVTNQRKQFELLTSDYSATY